MTDIPGLARRGRKPKKRPLTIVLEAASRKRTGPRGSPQYRQVVASMLWELAANGLAQFPDGSEIAVRNASEWLDVVKFLHGQIDGPPKDNDTTFSGKLTVVWDLPIPQQQEE